MKTHDLLNKYVVSKKGNKTYQIDHILDNGELSLKACDFINKWRNHYDYDRPRYIHADKLNRYYYIK